MGTSLMKRTSDIPFESSRRVSIGVLTSIGLALSAGPASAATREMPECGEQQLLGYEPSDTEVKAHRQFSIPTVHYAFGTKLPAWGLILTVHVDAAGRVTCYQLKETQRYERIKMLNRERRELVAGLKAWRYTPFGRTNEAYVAIVTERISEDELPGAHRPVANVPLAAARILLQRSSCYGPCPDYTVEVRGSGQVHYVGNSFVDVRGEHDYQVSAAEVARLVESMRAKDLWSVRDRYSWGGYDNPAYKLTLQLGDEIHTIEDSNGDEVGMPEVVRAFESEVDEAAHSKKWIELSNEALDTSCMPSALLRPVHRRTKHAAIHPAC